MKVIVIYRFLKPKLNDAMRTVRRETATPAISCHHLRGVKKPAVRRMQIAIIRITRLPTKIKRGQFLVVGLSSVGLGGL